MKKIRIFVPVVLGLMVCSLLLGCGNVTGGGGGGGGGTASSIIYVSTTGSDDAGNGSAAKPYEHIQKGLDKVKANGTVSVESGIYVENLVWPSTEGVTLRGASMSTTTLDANNVNRGILIDQSDSIKTAKIEKMTITKAHRIFGGSGAGIYFSTPDTTLSLYEVYIHHCSMESSDTVHAAGFASDLDSTTLEAIACLIKDNSVFGSGAGIGGMSIAGTCYISSCEISDNYGGAGTGGLSVTGNGGRIENSIIHHNVSTGYYGGGLYVNVWPEIDIINCTIASNDANDATLGKGGGVASCGGDNTLVNCIIYGNTATVASNEVWLNSGAISVTYSNIKDGYTGTGNTGDDPLFTSVTDFHLSDITPSTVYGGATLEAMPSCDYDGNDRTDPYSMGAYEGD